MKKKFIIGKKLGMTQILDKEGEAIPVTVIKVDENIVVKVKKSEVDGYSSVLVGVDSIKESKLNKPKKGFFEKIGVTPKRYLKEFRVADNSSFEPNQSIPITIFELDEKVAVRSKSTGKGFAGTIKRHNFSRGLMSHGSKSHRLPGSIGAGTTPARVLKGTRMAGHLGDEFVTVQNLVVVEVNSEKGYLLLKGAVPGKKNNLVEIFN